MPIVNKVAEWVLWQLCTSVTKLLKQAQTWNSAAVVRAFHYPLRVEYPDIDHDTPGVGAHSEYLVLI